jgi:hypoxanthine phosphoribosyltransferase
MKEPEKKLVFSKQQIDEAVRRLARDISRTHAGREIILVGVLNGVFMFFADLVRYLAMPVKIDFIRLASYGQNATSSGRVLMTKDVEHDLTGKHVLVVEDIADSGLTIEWLRKHLRELGAASVEVCVLINKLERRDVEVQLDYVGFEVQQGFLVGYGLDYDGRYRNLNQIYHLVMD